MTIHPFKAAVENGVSADKFASLFTPDVTLRTPMLAKIIGGRDLVVRVISTAARIGKPYYTQVGDSHRTILLWTGMVDGYKLQAATMLVNDAVGLIRHVIVLMRPWPVVTHFREAMHRELSSILPDNYRQLDPQSTEDRLEEIIPAVSQDSPEKFASNVTFHSPILTKSVSGREQVSEAIECVHKILGSCIFLLRFVTPMQSIDLWEVTFQGYPMQGFIVNQLDSDGAITDHTVILRPWPVVPLLRDAVKALQISFLLITGHCQSIHKMFHHFRVTILNRFKISKRDSTDGSRRVQAMVFEEQPHRKRHL